MESEEAAQLLASAELAKSRYERTMQRTDLDLARSSYERLISGLHPDDRDLPSHKSALVEVLLMLGEYTDDIGYVLRAVQLAREVLDATAAEDATRIDRLTLLATALDDQSCKQPKKETALSALQYRDSALALVDEEHPQRASLVAARGRTIRLLVNHAGSHAEQLERARESVIIHEDALKHPAQNDEERAVILHGYARSLINFNERAPPEERRWEDAVFRAHESVRLTPAQHYKRYRRCGVLGMAYVLRHLAGDRSDLDGLELARQSFAEAISCVPQAHHAWRVHMLNLSNVLVDRHEACGSFADLQDGIAILRALVITLPENHPHRSARLHGLGQALFQSFLNRGLPGLLDESIECLQSAYQNGAPSQAHQKPELGHMLLERYFHRHDPSDLDKAVQAFESLLQSSLPPRRRHRSLANLANVLTIRYSVRRDTEDLERAHQYYEEVIQVREPHELGDISQVLNAYGLSVQSRYRYQHQAVDLQKSAELFQKAVDTAWTEHPRLAAYYRNLGTAQRRLHSLASSSTLLDDSITSLRKAVHLTPPRDPLSAKHKFELALALNTQFKLKSDSRDLIEASALLRTASVDTGSFVMDRWNAARERATLLHAHPIGKQAALESYELAISLLPRIACFGVDEEVRYEMAQNWVRLGSDAAACAISLSKPELAVEFLENSRSVLWSQLFQITKDLQDIRRIAPALVDELAAVEKALELNMRAPFYILSDGKESHALYEEQLSRARRRLLERRERLHEQIRRIAGGRKLFGWTTYRELRPALTVGPVVLLNVSLHRCDGIMMGKDHSLRVFPLASARSELLERWSRQLTSILQQSRDRTTTSFADRHVCQLLEMLWRDVGSPLWQAMKPMTREGELLRTWLMPTGGLASLPIHAAMTSKPVPFGIRIQDFMIPSYIPTLSALIRGQEEITAPSSFDLLAVGCPNTPGQKPLPSWKEEKEMIYEVFPKQSVTILEGEEATIQNFFAALPQATAVHVCCHGQHGWTNPYDSQLMLQDGPVTLRALSKQSRKFTDLAFLSACHSARLDPRALESVHLASGMNLAGSSSVVVTMWSIADMDAPVAVKAVYSHMAKNSRSSQPRVAAEAVHQAVQELRRKKVPAIRWVPFMHLGI